MKKKALVISAIAVTSILAGGWALAQSVGHGPMGFGPSFMHGQGRDGMGPGMMMKGMDHGMRPGMMKRMGHGPGMMQGTDHGMDPGMMKGHGMMKGMGPGMKGMGPGMMRGRAGFADPARLETLKTELKITPAQEQAWSTYAKAVQDAAATMKTTRESVDPEAVSKMTLADRYAFVSKMREQGRKQFGTVQSAADELLATLDATQRATATDILPGLAFGPPMRGAFASDHQHRD